MIVVTGASGFLGAALVDHLATAGVAVTGVDRRPAPLAAHGRHVVAELTDRRADVRRLLGGADVIVHLAARPGVRDRTPGIEQARQRDNVVATRHVLAAATGPVIVASSSSVYGGTVDGRASHEDDPLRPTGGYARSKAAAEARCAAHRAAGGTVCVVRPFTVVGPGQRPDMAIDRWLRAALAGRPIEVYGRLDRSRDVTDIGDVTRALAALISIAGVDSLPDVVNLGTGRRRTLGDLATAVQRAVPGAPIVTVDGPPRTRARPHARRRSPPRRHRRVRAADGPRRRGRPPARCAAGGLRRRLGMRARLAALGVVAAGAAVAAAGCGGDDDAGRLTVYSGRHYGIESAFERFSDETGIGVDFLTGNDAELRERIAAEGEDTSADVYLTVDAGNLWAAAEDGIFQPLDSEVLDEAIPAELRDEQGRWFGLALRVRTIVYNTDLVDPSDVPTTYEELADPEYEGRLCLRNASNDYQQSLVASMIAADGEAATIEVLQGWARNAEIFANDVELLETMAAGACEIGVVNHYYLAQLLEDEPDAPIGLLWAEQDGRGVHINISGGGVTRYADDIGLAQQFLEWLATEGQDTLVADNHEYPANPAVAPEPLIAERFGTDFARDQLHADLLGSLNADAVRAMDTADFG